VLKPPSDFRTLTLLGDLNPRARESLTILVAELARWETLPHTCLKPGESRSVWRVTTSTEVVTIKCRRQSLWGWLRFALGQSPLHREVKGAAVLAGAKIRTAVPLALCRGSRTQCLILRHVPGRTLLECMADANLTNAQRQRIAISVGRQLRQMGEQGVMNRDHKPSNLIVDDDIAGEPLVTVIDAAGVFQSPVRGWGMPAMLASLVIEPTGCGVRLRGCDVVRVLREVIKNDGLGHWKHVRDLLGAAKELVAAHGDPTPAVNPLAQSPRG